MPTSESHSAASDTLLDIDDLSVKRGNFLAIKDVSFCIHSGDFVGLIGQNGAGKTTLLKAILGLIKAESGTVKINTRPVSYIPQQLSQDRQIPISVDEVVGLASTSKRAAHEALAEVDMTRFSKSQFNELSGGQQQRVLIAKALASAPRLLILDEPTTGVDEASQANFYKLLQGLNKKGIAILMVSHDIDVVLSQVNRVICLNRSVVYDGAPDKLNIGEILPKLYSNQHKMLHHKHEAANV